MSDKKKIKNARDTLVSSIKLFTETLGEEWQGAGENQQTLKLEEFVTPVLNRLINEKKIKFAASTKKTIEKSLKILARQSLKFPTSQLLKDFIWEVEGLCRTVSASASGEAEFSFDHAVKGIIQGFKEKCILNPKDNKLYLTFLGVDDVPFDFVQLIYQTARICIRINVKNRKLADRKTFDDRCMEYYSDFLYNNFLDKKSNAQPQNDDEEQYNFKVETLLKKNAKVTDEEFKKIVSQSVSFFFNGVFKNKNRMKENTKRLLMSCLSPQSLIHIDGKKCRKEKFQITPKAFVGLSEIVTKYIEKNITAGWDNKKDKEVVVQDCRNYCNSLKCISLAERICLVEMVNENIFHDFWRTKIDKRIYSRTPSPNWSQKTKLYKRSICVVQEKKKADFFSEEEVCKYMDKARKSFELSNPGAIYFRGESSLHHYNIYQAIHFSMAVFANNIAEDKLGTGEKMKGWINLIDIQTALFDSFLPEKMTNKDKNDKPLPEGDERGVLLPPDDFVKNLENRDQVFELLGKLAIEETVVCLISMYKEEITNRGDTGFPLKEIANYLNGASVERVKFKRWIEVQVAELDYSDDTIDAGLAKLFSKEQTADIINTIWQRVRGKLNPERSN